MLKSLSDVTELSELMAPDPVSFGFAAALFALFQQKMHSFFPGTASGKLEIKSFANSNVISREPLVFLCL